MHAGTTSNSSDAGMRMGSRQHLHHLRVNDDAATTMASRRHDDVDTHGYASARDTARRSGAVDEVNTRRTSRRLDSMFSDEK